MVNDEEIRQVGDETPPKIRAFSHSELLAMADKNTPTGSSGSIIDILSRAAQGIPTGLPLNFFGFCTPGALASQDSQLKCRQLLRL